jgi:hypothetical protein
MVSAYLQSLALSSAPNTVSAEAPLHIRIGAWIATLPGDQHDGPHPTNILHQRFDATPLALTRAMVRLGFSPKRMRYDAATVAYWVK